MWDLNDEILSSVKAKKMLENEFATYDFSQEVRKQTSLFSWPWFPN